MIHLNELTVDWLTITCTTSGEEINAIAQWAIRTGSLKFGKVSRWRDFNGVRWHTLGRGGDSARYFVGKRKEIHRGKRRVRWIMIASGENAHILLPHFLSPDFEDCRVTRLDIQCTVPKVDFLSLSLPVREGVYSSRVTNSEGGETLYIGKRSDDIMARVYKKRLRQGERGDSSWEIEGLRFEMEYKGGVARARWRDIVKRNGEIQEDWRWLLDACPHLLPFSPGTSGDVDLTPVKDAKCRPDTMSWLKTHVHPAVVRMLSDHDNRDEMVELLNGWVEEAIKRTLRCDELRGIM